MGSAITNELFDSADHSISSAKPMPVILLLDTSGSMHERMPTLNTAVKKVIATLKKEENLGCEFLVSIITFGNVAKIHTPPTPASLIHWTDMKAYGCTPLGEAIKLAKELIEDREKTPSRAWRPTVFLVSDGMPTDQWQGPFNDFVENGRSRKCDRMAMAIGSGTHEEMLNMFIGGTTHSLKTEHDAEGIDDAFKYLTMSVTMRMKSTEPNKTLTEAETKSAFDNRAPVDQSRNENSGNTIIQFGEKSQASEYNTGEPSDAEGFDHAGYW